MDLSRRLDRIEAIFSSMKLNTYTVYMADGTIRRIAPEDCIILALEEGDAIRNIERSKDFDGNDGMLLELIQGLIEV